MPNSYEYPFAQSDSGNRRPTAAVSSSSANFETTSLADCSAMSFSGFSPANMFFTLFYLPSDAYLRDFRFAVGGFTQGAQPRFITWDTGSEYVNGTGGSTTFSKVEEKIWPDSILDTGVFMSSKNDFSNKLRAGWAAISVDQVESAQTWNFFAKQTLGQFSNVATSGCCTYQRTQTLGASVPSSVVFANNGSNNASILPWMKFVEVFA